MDVVLPLLSTIVSFIFAGMVLAQYRLRRKAYQLVWAFGLVSYGIGAFCGFLFAIGLGSVFIYSAWYIFGAFFVAAYLGMGTVYLMVPRRIAHAGMAVLGAFSLVAVALVMTAGIDMFQLAAHEGLSGKAMPGHVRMLTPLFNIFGTVALVGGAAYSAWIFWRRRDMPQRALSNALIAGGAMLPAIGGSMLRFGIPELFYLFEFLGVVVIFIGFLANHEIVASRLTARAAARASA
jgi:hypothetical protein